MPSLTVENYAKAVLQIGLETGKEQVSTGQLAQALNVSPGSVTSMLKTLAESELADYRPYEGVTLTRAGHALAMRMVRRHRLIELFLVRTLSLSWDQVHEEAEHMEHAVSDFLIDRIDEYLGHPELDPHGDPIPSAEGELRGDVASAVPLTECSAQSRVRLVRVTDQSPEFLRYLSEAGWQLGAEAVVQENSSAGGVVITRVGECVVSMSREAAEQLWVEPLD